MSRTSGLPGHSAQNDQLDAMVPVGEIRYAPLLNLRLLLLDDVKVTQRVLERLQCSVHI